MLYWSSSYCIMTIMSIVYEMVVLLMAYCTCTHALCCFLCCFLFAPFLYDSIICGQFIFLLGRPVSEL